MDGGWIKIHRKMLKWEWYKDTNTKVVFLHLLLNANYEQNRWLGNVIEVGEVPTSIKALSKELGLTVKQVRTALEHLKWTNEVAIRKANGAANGTSIIKVCNYGIYQCIDDFEGQAEGQAEGQTERQANGKRTASEGQANGKQTATLKEIKNKRNKEIKEGEEIEEYIPDPEPEPKPKKQPAKKKGYGTAHRVKLTDAELERLYSDFGQAKTDEAIEYLDSYICEKGDKYRDHNRTLRRWVFDAIDERDQRKSRMKGSYNSKPQTDEEFFGGILDWVKGWNESDEGAVW